MKSSRTTWESQERDGMFAAVIHIHHRGRLSTAPRPDQGDETVALLWAPARADRHARVGYRIKCNRQRKLDGIVAWQVENKL